MKELIRKLVEAWGPSGYEHQVRELIRQEIEGLADDVRVDALGNLICRVGQGGKKVMVAAHMDEIGVMATFREQKTGYLRFAAVGGLVHSTLYGNRVRFENGVIGVIGVHDAWGSSRTSVPNLDDFFIDVGDGNDETSPVMPGSPATLWRAMDERGTRLIAKSMDDRIGCVVAIETMRRLNKQTPNEVYFVFTVQEEVGPRGAGPAAYGIEPELGIALDVTPTGHLVKNEKLTVRLGDGAAIKVHDTRHIVPAAIRDWMVARAEADAIPYQLELLTLGSTDASAVQLARAGVPSGAISIPCRYVHTTSETVDSRDVEACVRLLTGLLGNEITL